MTREVFKEVSQKYDILDFLDLEESGLFVIYNDDTLLDKDHKVSIGIASAVTAYARIYMTQFKNNSKYKLCYSPSWEIRIHYLLRAY